jgi:hypothetical protein
VNAGEDGSIVVGKINDNETYTYGYDAQEGQYGDLVSKGIIDPTKVVRTALQDAASIAGLLMTTEAMVAEKPKKETPAMPPGGGMDYQRGREARRPGWRRPLGAAKAIGHSPRLSDRVQKRDIATPHSCPTAAEHPSRLSFG